ncbi:macro domain-containing protein, partial [Salmonella enterica]|nr:macro domain-containing protein [Salmonella enterica]
AEYKKIKSVVFPAMGAGCGQVPPDSVARQMKLAWDSFINCATEINWQYASDRQNAVFSTTAYCPQTLCPNARTEYIGSGDYRTYCKKSGGVCIGPRLQSDIRIGAHAHGVEIGAHGHPLHTECSYAHSLV